MNYDHEILSVLTEAGDKGLSLKKIAMHVYNRANGLFCAADIEDVRRYVANYVARVSRQSGSVIERTDERGVYRINNSCSDANQLHFVFKEYEPEQPNQSVEDTSLSLFD